MLIDAREYVGANQKTVLHTAALQLQKVDPRALVRDMIAWKASYYNVQVAEWREYGKDDEKHRRLIEAADGVLAAEGVRDGARWTAMYTGLGR